MEEPMITPEPPANEGVAPAKKKTHVDRKAVAYQAIPTHDPLAEVKDNVQKRHQASWGMRVVNDLRFQNFTGFVIVLNGAVIGMETDIHWSHWELVENSFLLFFLGELIFKLCAEGTDFFNPQEPDFLWNLFDSLIIGLGIFDATSSLFGGSGSGGFATIFRMIRLLRILRLFRLLKFLKRLYLLAMGLVEACKAIFWVTILMCFVLYVCAIVLVKTVGRPGHEDPHWAFLDEHYGSITKSMITLFILMSSPNLPIYQDEIGLLESRPYFTIFLIMFITFGSFGMLAMLTGVINESMFENNELRKEEKRMQHEDMRANFGVRCQELFDSLEQNEDGEATIEEVKGLAPQMIKLLEDSGARVAHGDILKFISNFDIDDSGTMNIVEFVQCMEKVAEGLNLLSVLEIQKSLSHSGKDILRTEERVQAMLEVCAKNEQTTQILLKEDLEENHERERSAGGQKEDWAKFDRFEQIDSSMRKLSEQVDGSESRVKRQMGELVASVQALLEQMDTNEQSRSSLAMTQVESAVAQQMGDLRASMQWLVSQKDRDKEILRAALGQQLESIQKCMQKDSGGLHPDVARSQQIGDMARYVQNVSEQIATLESSFQSAVCQQTGEIAKSVQNLLDQKSQGPESVSTVVADQLQEVQKALKGEIAKSAQNLLDQKSQGPESVSTVVADQLQEVQKALQGLADRRDEDNVTISKQIQEVGTSLPRLLDQWRSSNESQVHGFVSREVDEIHRSVQRFLDQKDCSEGRLQLAVSSQIHDIATAVQKLLRDKDSGETPKVNVSQHIQEIRESIQRLLDQTEESRDARIQTLQGQVSHAQDNLLGGVAELGGVVLGGVADLLAKNKLALQQEFNSLLMQLTQSQELALRKLLVTSHSDAITSAEEHS